MVAVHLTCPHDDRRVQQLAAGNCLVVVRVPLCDTMAFLSALKNNKNKNKNAVATEFSYSHVNFWSCGKCLFQKAFV